MAVQSTDIKAYRSATLNDTSSNGGRMSSTQEVSGSSNSLWPDVPESERTAGSTKYRKLFHKVEASSNSPLYNTRIGLMSPTPGDDKLVLFAGTQTDTQGQISNPTLYGAGLLHTTVNAGASQLAVQVEDGTQILYRDSSLLRVSDKTSITDPNGNEEFVHITGTPSVVGSIVTMNLSSQLQHGYADTVTYVSSLIEVGTLQTALSNVVVTSSNGTFTSANVGLYNVGGVYQLWTVTFTSATNYNVAGDVIGSVGNGNISSTFSPTNSAFGTPYFSLYSTVWGGTFATNDTVTFITSPAATAVWERRIVPAGAGSIQSQTRTLMIFGESGA